MAPLKAEYWHHTAVRWFRSHFHQIRLFRWFFQASSKLLSTPLRATMYLATLAITLTLQYSSDESTPSSRHDYADASIYSPTAAALILRARHAAISPRTAHDTHQRRASASSGIASGRFEWPFPCYFAIYRLRYASLPLIFRRCFIGLRRRHIFWWWCAQTAPQSPTLKFHWFRGHSRPGISDFILRLKFIEALILDAFASRPRYIKLVRHILFRYLNSFKKSGLLASIPRYLVTLP